MYEPLPVYKPAASRMQIEKAVEMLKSKGRTSGDCCRGGVINATQLHCYNSLLN